MAKIAALTTDFQLTREVGGVQMAQTPRYGGTCHYRLGIPGAALAAHGHEFVLTPALTASPQGFLIAEGLDGTRHFDCDVIWIQRWMHQDAPEQIRKAKACGQLVVNDVDDWFWGLPTQNVAFSTTHKKFNPEFNREHYVKALRASSGLTVSTPYLAQRLEKLGIPIEVCRNAIDIERWPQLDPSQEPATVGWVGGIPWRGSDLQVLRGILGPWMQEHEDVAFYHGGAAAKRCDDCAAKGKPVENCLTCMGKGKVFADNYPSAAEQLGLTDDNGDPTVWYSSEFLCEIEDYPELWKPIEIGVVPLDNTPFNHAKSWLKGLEAAACGIPFIAPGWHAEYRALECGRLAKSPSDWIKHLNALLDPVVRKEEGAANRLRAEELSIDKQWQTWERSFQRIARG